MGGEVSCVLCPEDERGGVNRAGCRGLCFVP